MSQSIEPYVLTNENAPAFWSLGTLWLPLATGVLTGNSLTLIEQQMPAQSGPSSHLHTQEEGFYILSGSCTFQVGGETIHATPGTLLHIPRDTSHSFETQEPTHALNFYLPSGFEHILLSVCSPAQTRTLPAPDAVPMPPPEFIRELSREYGQSQDLGMPWIDVPTEENRLTTPSKTNPIKPFATHLESAPGFWDKGMLWTMLATGEQTGGAYSALEQLCAKDTGPAPHWHEQDEALYLLEGQATFMAGEQVVQAGAGAFVFIPRGTLHSFRINSDTARLLNFYTPSGFERAIPQLGQPAATRTLPPDDFSPGVDKEKLKALFAQIGMHTVAVPDFLRDPSLPHSH